MYGFIDPASDHQNHVVVMKMIVNIDALPAENDNFAFRFYKREQIFRNRVKNKLIDTSLSKSGQTFLPVFTLKRTFMKWTPSLKWTLPRLTWVSA